MRTESFLLYSDLVLVLGKSNLNSCQLDRKSKGDLKKAATQHDTYKHQGSAVPVPPSRLYRLFHIFLCNSVKELEKDVPGLFSMRDLAG